MASKPNPVLLSPGLTPTKRPGKMPFIRVRHCTMPSAGKHGSQSNLSHSWDSGQFVPVDPMELGHSPEGSVPSIGMSGIDTSPTLSQAKARRASLRSRANSTSVNLKMNDPKKEYSLGTPHKCAFCEEAFPNNTLKQVHTKLLHIKGKESASPAAVPKPPLSTTKEPTPAETPQFEIEDSVIRFPVEMVEDAHSNLQTEEEVLNVQTQLGTSLTTNGVTTSLTTEKTKYTMGKRHICPYCSIEVTSAAKLKTHIKGTHPLGTNVVQGSEQSKTKDLKSEHNLVSQSDKEEDVTLTEGISALISEMLTQIPDLSATKSKVLDFNKTVSPPDFANPQTLPQLNLEFDRNEPMVIDNLPYMSVVLAAWHLLPVKIREDGFCILNATISSLAYTKYGRVTLEWLISRLKEYLAENKERYLLIGENTVNEILNFFETKSYIHNAIDAIPNLIANALEVNIAIFTDLGDNNFSLSKIIPEGEQSDGDPIPTICLIRTKHNTKNGKNLDTHYDVALPGNKINAKLKRELTSEGDWLLNCPKTKSAYHVFRSPSNLSNFKECKLIVDGDSFKCNEEYIQANRFPPSHPLYNQIRNARNPVRMKNLGDSAPKDIGRDLVNATKGLWAKFNHNPELKGDLLSTCDQILIEGTRSKTWGIGRDIRNDNSLQILDRTEWVGVNSIGILGTLLMIIREDITNQTKGPSWPLVKALLGHLAPSETFILPSTSYEPVMSSNIEKDVEVNVPSPPLSPTTTPTQSDNPENYQMDSPKNCTESHTDPRQPNPKVPNPHENMSQSHKEMSVTSPKQNTPPRSPTRTQNSPTVRPSPLVFPPRNAIQYFPPSGMSVVQTVNRVNSLRPDIGRFLRVQNNRIFCTHRETQCKLKFGIFVNDSVFSHPLYQRLPKGTFTTRWTTKPIPNNTNLHLEIAAHPRVLYMNPYHMYNTHTIWQVTTGYIRESPVPVLSEPKSLELRQGTLISLVPQGTLHCQKCRKNGHLRRACDVVSEHSIPKSLTPNEDSSSVKHVHFSQPQAPPPSDVLPLMDITFPNISLPRLERLHQKMTSTTNYPRETHFAYPNTNNVQAKMYAIELPLERLIHFWSIFPEWIPAISHCPLGSPSSFLVLPNHNTAS